ncbi:MAG: hypothetical protein AB1592_04190 [Pseudomonadota bacterium]
MRAGEAPAPQGATTLRPKARDTLKAVREVFLEAGYGGAIMDASARGCDVQGDPRDSGIAMFLGFHKV